MVQSATSVSSDGRWLVFSENSAQEAGGTSKSTNGNTPSSITRDGTRFLRIQQVEPERAITHSDLVLNWLEEVQRLATGGTK